MKRPAVVTPLEREVLAMAANFIGPGPTPSQCLKEVDAREGKIRSWWFKGLTVRGKLTVSEVGEVSTD